MQRQMQAQPNTRVNYQNANASANARNRKFFISLGLHWAGACICISQKMVNRGNAKMKNTRSMPLRFTFKQRWCPPPPYLLSFPESSFPGRLLVLGNADSWEQDCRHLGIVKCARVSHSAYVCVVCVRRVHLRLRLRRTCEPALSP